MRRFLVQGLSTTEQCLTLSREISHHILNVLRLHPGGVFILCDGAGGCCQVELEDVAAKQARVRVLETWQEPETAVRIELLQGLPQKERFDLVLQKNTELGVSRFVPVYTHRCQGRIEAKKQQRKQERWQRIVLEAARQSGRSWLPQIEKPSPLEQALAHCRADVRLVLWEEADTQLSTRLASVSACTQAGFAVLIGPEGGLDRTDIEVAARYGFVPVRLGPRILRTETAGFAVATLLQYLYGDLGSCYSGDKQKAR